jgi:hypothetical protein
LFLWRVPEGREIEAGREIGRHHILTHAYWREGGPEFANVNIMAVAHGTEKDTVLAHKAAIDAHLASIGMPVSYTNVFWGGRSEIKPRRSRGTRYGKQRTSDTGTARSVVGIRTFACPLSVVQREPAGQTDAGNEN